MRPVLIPVSMMIAWFAGRGSSSKGQARVVRILGIGAVVSVIILFIDGFMSTGF
jgi:hypothetical protein